MKRVQIDVANSVGLSAPSAKHRLPHLVHRSIKTRDKVAADALRVSIDIQQMIVGEDDAENGEQTEVLAAMRTRNADTGG